MRKLCKKIIATLLTATMAMTATVPAFAATENMKGTEPQVVMYADVQDMNTAIPEELVGLENFLSKDVQGCIQLDAEGALLAGYENDAVSFVQENINNINIKVAAGEMVVDDNFIAHSSNIATAAAGKSGVETTWYGTTFIYYNSDEAQDLSDAFNAAYTSCMTILTYLNDMNNEGVYDLTISGVVIVGYSAMLCRDHVINAASEGTGIVWTIAQDYNTGTIGWGFSAQ